MALARALAPRPKVLLLDEPFGALDARVRDELRTWLRKLHDEVHVTSLFVTHDQQEAFEVSDQIVVLNKGRVEQMGPPQELYEHPASPFVTEFLGAVNVLRVETVLGMDMLGDEMPLPMDIPGPGEAPPVRCRPRSTSGRTTSRSPASATADPPGPPGSAASPRWAAWCRLDLVLLDGTSLHVQLTRERCLALGLSGGENVFVTPKDLKVFHESKAFVENYVI